MYKISISLFLHKNELVYLIQFKNTFKILDHHFIYIAFDNRKSLIFRPNLPKQILNKKPVTDHSSIMSNNN